MNPIPTRNLYPQEPTYFDPDWDTAVSERVMVETDTLFFTRRHTQVEVTLSLGDGS